MKTSIEGQQFCSELAANFLRHAEVIDESINPGKVLPNTLLYICQDPLRWHEILPVLWSLWDEALKKEKFREKVVNVSPEKIALLEDQLNTELALARNLK